MTIAQGVPYGQRCDEPTTGRQKSMTVAKPTPEMRSGRC